MTCYTTNQQSSYNIRFSDLGSPRHIWAIPSIHGDVERLIRLHDAIYNQIKPGDRIIYLGNYTGYGAYSRETIDELLMFRRMVLAKPAMKVSDIIYLRGFQENLWQRLYQLPYDLFPVEGLLDIMSNGLGATMDSYDICPHEAIDAAKEGTIALTRWTNKVRQNLRLHPGHDDFMTHQHRAAYTHEAENFPLLFVNAGIDSSKTLEEQKDSFWEQPDLFEGMHQSYAPFRTVIRGFDPTHKGMTLNPINTTLDAGCGFGGPLTCTKMSAYGEFYEILES